MAGLHTDGKVDRVDPDPRIPTRPFSCPVRLHGVALGEKDDDTSQVGNDQAHRNGPRGVSKPFRVLDAEQQEKNGHLEETHAREEKDLANPSEHVVAYIVIVGDVPSVPPVADLHLSDLDRKPHDAEGSDDDDGVVIRAKTAQRKPYPDAEAGR